MTASLVAGALLVFVGVAGGAVLRSGTPAGTALESLWTVRDVAWLRRLGALDAVAVWEQGAWWRVGTGALLHGSWLHVGLNVLGLWSVGRWLEGALGGPRFLVVAAVAAVFGGMSSLAWAEAGLVVGMSGVVFGLAGAVLVLSLCGDAGARQRLSGLSVGELAFWVGLWLAIGYFAPGLGGRNAVIAQAGHVGGLIGGALAAVAVGWATGGREPGSVGSPGVSREGRSGAPRGELGAAGAGGSEGRRALRGETVRRLGWAAILVGGMALAGRASGPHDLPAYWALRGYAALDGDRWDAAAGHFGAAAARSPGDPDLLNAWAYALVESDGDAGLALELARAARARAASGSASVDAAFMANVLDTEGWARCALGEVEAGRVVLDQAVVAASAAGVDDAVMRDHLDRCEARARGLPAGAPRLPSM